ncbi:MAG: ATP-binding protein [Dehalococcoidia bacterium]
MARGNLFRPGGWRLSTRVIVAASVLLAILLAIVIATQTQAGAERRRSEIDHAVDIGRATAGIVDGFARDLEATVLAVAVILGGEVGPLDQESAGPHLSALEEEYGLLRALFVTDAAGEVLASDSGVGLGVQLADRPYMQRLMAGAPTVWSGGLAGLESGEVVVSYGRAMHSPAGEFRGYVIAAFYPPLVVERLASHLPADADVILIDHNGFVLHSTAFPDLAPDARALDAREDVRAALEGEAVRIDGSAGILAAEERFGAIVPVAANGWAVSFTRPLAPLEAALQRDLLSQVAVVTLAVAAVAAVLTLVTNRMMRPLGDLAGAASAVARGERPEIPAGHREVEVRQLADSMRLMSAAVAEREDALRRESGRRTVLAEASRAFAEAGLDLERELGTVAHRICTVVGDGCMVVLGRGDAPSAEPVALHHRSDRAFEHLRALLPHTFTPSRDSVALRALLNGQPALLANVSKEEFKAAVSPALGPYVDEFGPHSLSVQPMSAHGRLIGAIIVWRDETREPYTAEDYALLQEIAGRAALAIENARLFREVSEHAVAVDRAMHAHHESVALASHDLKNPLATIRASAQWLRRETERGRVIEQERLLAAMEAIETASVKATEEIDAMLDAASLQSGGAVALSPDEVDLASLLQGICEEFRQVGEDHRIVLDAGEGGLSGDWDAARLQRAFGNLLNNAIKYSPDGGDVSVSARRQQVDGTDWAVVQVRDQGVGIPAAALPRIFERFYRAENVEGRFEGNGLGLTGVRYIVEAHNGRVEVVSAEGEGSVFTVRLPCRAASTLTPADEAPPPQVAEPAPSAGE